MHHLAHPGFGGGRYQDPRVGDRVAETDAAVREANPIAVVKNVGAAKTLDQRGVVGEFERRYVDIDLLRPWALRVVGEGADAPAAVQQLAGDEAPRIAERAGDDIEPGFHR